MLDLSKYGKLADKMEAFISGIERTGIVSSDLSKLSEIIPNLAENLSIISNWINGVNDVIPEIPEPVSESIVEKVVFSEPVQEVMEKVVEEVKEEENATPNADSRKHYQITKDKSIEIAKFIADKCDGKKISAVVKTVGNKFKKVPYKSIDRLVRKVTFDRYTDEYFVLNDDRIISLTKNLRDRFTASRDDMSKIAELIRKNDYDVIKAISNDMSANDILKLAMVRLKMFTSGEASSLGGGVKEIFIMSEISRNKRGTTNDIIKAIKTVYEVDVDVVLISAVRTGRAYKDIAAKFGVL